MAQLRTRSFADVAATGNSAGVKIADLENVYVMIQGTFVGTWTVQVSFDGGTTYATFATGTESGQPSVTAKLPPCTHTRLGFTRTSGTLVGRIGGDARAA